MRAYVNYLDGYFIPTGKSGCSHSGLYTGNDSVVHSIAEGSVTDDIIDFCRADRIVILRPASGQEWAIEHAKKCADANIEYDFNYCHEFTASCFPGLDIKPLSRKVFRLIPSPVVYLADSFYISKDFQLVYDSSLPAKK
jgi:hypothetical protein